MSNELSINYNHDRSLLQIKFSDFLDLEISELDFAFITALYLDEIVSIMELCKNYQEQLVE